MGTSGSTDFSVTRDNLITDVLIEIGAIPIDGAPSSNDLTVVSRRLNMLLKHWANFGLLYHTIKTELQQINITAGKASYTLGTTGSDITNTDKPIRVQEAYLLDADSNKVPLRQLSKTEFEGVNNITDTGTPYCFYYEPFFRNASTGDAYFGKIYLYPVPTSADTAYDLYTVHQRPMEDLDGATDVLDMPAELYHAFFRVAVVECSAMYGREVKQAAASLAYEAFRVAIGAAKNIYAQPMMGHPNDEETVCA